MIIIIAFLFTIFVETIVSQNGCVCSSEQVNLPNQQSVGYIQNPTNTSVNGNPPCSRSCNWTVSNTAAAPYNGISATLAYCVTLNPETVITFDDGVCTPIKITINTTRCTAGDQVPLFSSTCSPTLKITLVQGPAPPDQFVITFGTTTFATTTTSITTTTTPVWTGSFPDPRAARMDIGIIVDVSQGDGLISYYNIVNFIQAAFQNMTIDTKIETNASRLSFIRVSPFGGMPDTDPWTSTVDSITTSLNSTRPFNTGGPSAYTDTLNTFLKTGVSNNTATPPRKNTQKVLVILTSSDANDTLIQLQTYLEPSIYNYDLHIILVNFHQAPLPKLEGLMGTNPFNSNGVQKLMYNYNAPMDDNVNAFMNILLNGTILCGLGNYTGPQPPSPISFRVPLPNGANPNNRVWPQAYCNYMDFTYNYPVQKTSLPNIALVKFTVIDLNLDVDYLHVYKDGQEIGSVTGNFDVSSICLTNVTNVGFVLKTKTGPIYSGVTVDITEPTACPSNVLVV